MERQNPWYRRRHLTNSSEEKVRGIKMAFNVFLNSPPNPTCRFIASTSSSELHHARALIRGLLVCWCSGSRNYTIYLTQFRAGEDGEPGAGNAYSFMILFSQLIRLLDAVMINDP